MRETYTRRRLVVNDILHHKSMHFIRFGFQRSRRGQCEFCERSEICQEPFLFLVREIVKNALYNR